jgi:hypothetical protein
MTKHLLPLTESQLFQLELLLESASLDIGTYTADERLELKELLDTVVQFNLLVIDDGV